MNYIKLYPGFKKKCVTLSYDDGVIQDRKLLEILNHYGILATFNLNSGLFSQRKFRDGVDNSRLSEEEVRFLYQGHEIAAHTLYHPHLENLSYKEIKKEIKKDQKKLQKLFPQQNGIYGFAYPFGTYNEDVLKVLKEVGICYARTVTSTYSFSLPRNFLLLNPTIHHNDARLDEVLEKFFVTEEELALFYLWGHSYEFANQNNFEIIERFAQKVSEKKDIYFATNIDVYNYIIGVEMVYSKNGVIYNPSSITVYLNVGGININLPPRSEYQISK